MIRKAVSFVEDKGSEFVPIFLQQRNIFSAVVGILGAQALASFSPFEHNPHKFQAQQQFPDLIARGSGSPPRPTECLESKGSLRPWALQAHYDHAGWYVVWRYLVDETLVLTGRPVVVWRVHLAFLEKSDWQYEKSGAGPGGGGRTHTFGVKEPSERLRDKAVYDRDDIRITRGKPVPR